MQVSQMLFGQFPMSVYNRLSYRKVVFAGISSLLLVAAVTGCSFSSRDISSPSAVQTENMYLPAGQIVIARPMPSMSEISTEHMLGFLPTRPELKGLWLKIERGESTVSLMDGDNLVLSSRVSGLDSISPGRYEVVHKQRNALWRANSEYYQRRSLPVPSEFDPDRLLKGVLGNYALFLDENLPIHCGPAEMEEVGGMQLNEKDISRIYYAIEVGTPAVIL